MKRLYKFILVLLSIMNFCTAFAQTQTFDVITYSVPKGWQQKQNDGSVQLLATDNKTGAYAMAIIAKATPSNASAIENFNAKWKAAIADQVQLKEALAMQPASSGNGWDIETGGSAFTDNGVKGKVALLSATGGGQTMCVVIMYNSNQYDKDLAAFLNSLELAKLSEYKSGNLSEPAPKSSTKPTQSSTMNAGKTTNKGKKCTNCSGGYIICTICSGTGNTWQQQQSFNSSTKQYEYTRALESCTACGGMGRKMCTVATVWDMSNKSRVEIPGNKNQPTLKYFSISKI